MVRDNAVQLRVSPELSANFLSRLFWCWTSRLITVGYKKSLQTDDLYEMNPRESSQWCVDRWQAAWQKNSADTNTPSCKPAGKNQSLDRTKCCNSPEFLHSEDFQGNGKCAEDDKIDRNNSCPALGRNQPNIVERWCGDVWGALWECFWMDFCVAATWRPVWLVFVVAQVYVLKGLVEVAGVGDSATSTGGEDASWWRCSLLVTGMLVTSMGQSVAQHHCFTAMQKLGMKVRSIVCYAVFHKALKMTTAAMVNSTQGHMLNLITNDTQKILDAATHIHFVWSAIFDMVVICVLVFVEIGASAVGGIVSVALMVPIQIWMARRVGEVRMPAVSVTDARVRLVREVVNGIRVVKYNGWVPQFLEKIAELRKKELEWIQKAAYFRSANSAQKDTVTPLACLVTFGLYVAIHGGSLTASKAFSVLAFFSLLARVFSIAPQGLQFFSESIVAIRRLGIFLHLPDGNGHCSKEIAQAIRQANTSAVLTASLADFDWIVSNRQDKPEHWSSTRNETFTSNPKPKKKKWLRGRIVAKDVFRNEPGKREGGLNCSGHGFGLREVTMSMKANELLIVTGDVGSGKSSLLLALLGEMESVGGSFFVEGHVAYAPQQPWIFNDTIRNNILFGEPFAETRFVDVCRACALDADVATFQAGYDTEIGEQGLNLSGGQRFRITLARAAYSSKSLIFLDDPTAAVDSITARHIREELITDLLLEKRKASVLLVTSDPTPFRSGKRILIVDSGRVREVEGKTGNERSEGKSGEGMEEIRAGGEGRRKGEGKDEEVREEPGEIQVAKVETGRGRCVPGEVMPAGTLTVKEDRVEGVVRKEAYLAYVTAGGGWTLLSLLVTFFLVSQAVRTLVDYWLGIWVDSKYKLSDGVYILVFAALTFGAALLSLLRALLFTFIAMKAAKNLHNNMAEHVLRSPQLFFDQNPVGRILNRFSKDQSLVDELLPNTAQITLEFFLASLGSLVLIVILLPWLLLCLPPLIFVFFTLQRRYTRASRELRRLEGVTRSPMLNHFTQSLQGATSIRAFGTTDTALRKFVALVDANHRAFVLFVHAGRWLGIRLDGCATICVTATALAVVLSRGSLSAGIAGVALVQSLQLSGFLQYAVRQAAETENFFTSVERIYGYGELPTESSHLSDPIQVPPDWPQHGHVSVEDLVLAYRPNLPPTLKGVTFEVQPGERIGILGRTGAGKSSLAAALFRMVENESCGGRILIDGIDIRSVGLEDLRQRLSMIPQDPVLFNRTVRQNLDPFEKFSDLEIVDALQNVHLYDKIVKDGGGLSAVVTENGENFSVGERQLLCLARALLRRSRIVVMDEATASVDRDTDRLIQQTIRNAFSACTLLVIAHRIETVIDSNRVLLLEEGNVAEYGRPVDLLNKGKAGLFAKMVYNTGQRMCAILKLKAAQSSEG